MIPESVYYSTQLNVHLAWKKPILEVSGALWATVDPLSILKQALNAPATNPLKHDLIQLIKIR